MQPNLHQGRFGPLGWRGANSVTDRIVEMVSEARNTIALTSFYFKPVPVLWRRSWLRQTRRTNRVYHSHRDALPATDLAWIASAVSYDRMLDAGIQVYENRHGEHSKIVLVDRARVAFGSYNFEDAAHDRLAEAMLATATRATVAAAATIFDDLRRDPDNLRVTTERLRALPPRLKRRRALYGRFKRWM